jgi:CheY-like chemotaxis protein
MESSRQGARGVQFCAWVTRFDNMERGRQGGVDAARDFARWHLRCSLSCGVRILIAEDDVVSQKVLKTNLERLGHEVTAASDGAAAWAAFDENPARIVVSDWMMPDMDGLELCRRVRERAKTEYTYFILLTAKTGQENYQLAMQAGVDDFLNKPLNREELVNRLRVAERILSYATQIRQLKELLPICAYCKKVRDDQNYWQQIETYIHQHTGSDFSHSICPDCYERIVKPEIAAFAAARDGVQTT